MLVAGAHGQTCCNGTRGRGRTTRRSHPADRYPFALSECGRKECIGDLDLMMDHKWVVLEPLESEMKAGESIALKLNFVMSHKRAEALAHSADG